MISIPAALSTALSTGRCQPCEAIRIQTVTMGDVELTTAPHNVIWSGRTWLAGQGIIEVTAPEEDSENVATEMSITLSLKRFDLRQEIMNQNLEGRAIRMWLLVLNTATGTVIGDGIEMSNRYVSVDEISRGPTTMEIRILGESILARQLDASRATRGDAPQQKRFPGDKFFADLNKLARGLSVTVQTINVRQRS